MADQVRAKLRVVSIDNTVVQLQAVVGGSPEDNTFSAATPWADMKMGVTNPDALEFFKPNATYYVDFTPADKPAT